MNTSVGEDIQNEIRRNIKLVHLYKSIGPAGLIGATLIQQDIDAAVKALSEGDCVAIIQCYQALKGNNT